MDPLKPEDLTKGEAEALLGSLRWKADMDIINDSGEHVWLKPCCDAQGKRIGITDCCLVSAPCQNHARLKPRIV